MSAQTAEEVLVFDPSFSVPRADGGIDSNGVSLVAVARDSDGLVGLRSSEFEVVSDVQLPVVSLTAPEDGISVVEGHPLTLTASATDNAAVERIDLFYRNANVATQTGRARSLSVARDVVPPASEVGNLLRVFARGRDVNGLVGESAAVAVLVEEDQPPAIAIAQIENVAFGTIGDVGAALARGGVEVLEGTDLVINVRASDDAGLERLVVVAGDSTAPTDLDVLPEGAVKKVFSGPKRTLESTAQLTYPVPRGSAGSAFVVRVFAVDVAGAGDPPQGQVARAEFTVRVRGDQAPQVALTTPIADRTQNRWPRVNCCRNHIAGREPSLTAHNSLAASKSLLPANH